MSKSIILHDTRLHGTAPLADHVITVNGTTSLSATLLHIAAYASAQAQPCLLEIMCHGYETHNDPVNQQSTVKAFGGGGLQLCQEDLTLNTVGLTRNLLGYLSQVTVYSCGAANTRPGYENTNWDGQRLWREMAAHTGAIIYAADVTQWYWRSKPLMSTDEIDFRRFEGNLYRFDPSGLSTVVESNQTEAW